MAKVIIRPGTMLLGSRVVKPAKNGRVTIAWRRPGKNQPPPAGSNGANA